jgi:plastocyanin
MRPSRLARPLAFAAVLLGLSLFLAACASSQPTAGWTFQPPSASPAASAAASGAPSAAASAAPSAAAPSASPAGSGGAPSGAPGASGGGAATVIPLVASGLKFDKASLDAPGGKAFQIAFDNQDAGIPHNVYVKDGSGKTVFDGGTPFNGPAQKTYDVPALQAGTYTFACIVHPTMTGTLNVK